MRYIGDLSSQDAQLLAEMAKGAEDILEFGAGASTQIFAQAAPATCRITSIETDPRWIERTRRNLALLGVTRPVTFRSWKEWLTASAAMPGVFDLIFDDGVDKLRAKFAMHAWPLLRIGGKFLFHDTRRSKDAKNVNALLAKHYLEVDTVAFNTRSSNITVLIKKAPEPWVDWNVVERRAKWEYGHEEPPPGLWGDEPSSRD